MINDKNYYINTYVPKKFRPYIDDFFKDECGWWVFLDINDFCHFNDLGSGSELTQHEDTLAEVVRMVREYLVEGPVSDEYRH